MLATGLDAELQTLSVTARELEDDSTLADYDIQAGSTLFLGFV
jgi:hypothetical protein